MLPACCGRGGMADTAVSKTDASRHVGSSPTVRTPNTSTLSALTNSERLLYYLPMRNTGEFEMKCSECSVDCQLFGKHRNGLRRFRYPQCKRTFTEPHTRTLDTMYISQDRAVLALQLLLEGNSIRSTERICGMDRNTIMSLIVKAGERCKTLMIFKIVNLPVKDVQAD